MDDFLGVAEIDDRGTLDPSVKEYKLFGKGKKGREIEMPGKLKIELTTSDDLMDL